MSSGPNSLYRMLPSLDDFLRLPAMVELSTKDGEVAVKESAREVLNRLRDGIASGKTTEPDLVIEKIIIAIREHLTQSFTPSLRSVINATGVILHTNLGRAPLSTSALTHIQTIAAGYSNLEFDSDTGERGKRDVH